MNLPAGVLGQGVDYGPFWVTCANRCMADGLVAACNISRRRSSHSISWWWIRGDSIPEGSRMGSQALNLRNTPCTNCYLVRRPWPCSEACAPSPSTCNRGLAKVAACLRGEGYKQVPPWSPGSGTVGASRLPVELPLLLKYITG
jgi:hypothetical protein